MSIAESDRLEPAVEALLRAESWRAPAPALRAARIARAAARGVRWHRAQSSRRRQCVLTRVWWWCGRDTLTVKVVMKKLEQGEGLEEGALEPHRLKVQEAVNAMMKKIQSEPPLQGRRSRYL